MASAVTHDDPSQTVNPRAWALIEAVLYDRDARLDPYDAYAELHALGDDFVTPNGTHIVIGHQALTEMMLNPQFRKNNDFGASQKTMAFSPLTDEQQKELDDWDADSEPMLGSLDAPDHMRIRGLVQRNFLPKHVNALREQIAIKIDELLAVIDPTEPADMSSQFGTLFAPEIMAELIGLPSEHRAYVSELTGIFMQGVDPAAPFAVRLASAKAAHAQREYVRKVVASRRESPRDDLVTALVQESGGVITERELVQLLTILYIGGYETTAHMIGNGLVALLRHPDQFALLRGDPDSHMRSAVNEMLRYDGAISFTQLYPVAGAELAGKPAHANMTYIGLVTAGNRDPEVYDDPNSFRIGRERGPILTFGAGPHGCLGINLARLELDMVFRELLRRFPRMRLLEERPPRVPLFQQQAYARVPVLLDPPV
jgi:cytochrome P450